MSLRNLVGLGIAVVLCLLSSAAVAEPFSIVVLPDTQFYSSQFPQTFMAQTRWVADHAADQNIVFVTHLGDVVDGWEPDVPWLRGEGEYRA